MCESRDMAGETWQALGLEERRLRRLGQRVFKSNQLQASCSQIMGDGPGPKLPVQCSPAPSHGLSHYGWPSVCVLRWTWAAACSAGFPGTESKLGNAPVSQEDGPHPPLPSCSTDSVLSSAFTLA